MLYFDKQFTVTASRGFNVLKSNLERLFKEIISKKEFETKIRPVIDYFLYEEAVRSAKANYPNLRILHQGISIGRGSKGVPLLNKSGTSFNQGPGGGRTYSSGRPGTIASSIIVTGRAAPFAQYLNSGGTMYPRKAKYLSIPLDSRIHNYNTVRDYLESKGPKKTFTATVKKTGDRLIFLRGNYIPKEAKIRYYLEGFSFKTIRSVESPTPVIKLVESIKYKASNWADKAAENALKATTDNINKIATEVYKFLGF